jgi:hypothetical protein
VILGIEVVFTGLVDHMGLRVWRESAVSRSGGQCEERAMAKDDRVIMIEADLPTHIASVTTETVGFELTRAREFLAHAGLERLAGRPGALGRRTSPRYLC